MQLNLIRALLGLLLLIFSLTMLLPLGFAFYYREETLAAFLLAFTITAATGAALWLPKRGHQGQLRARDGFLITSLFWLVLGSFGALPLYFASQLDMTLTDAVFESVSGLTTTGATVITGLDALPKSLLYYRQQLQWLGGIGIIVIAIAILPMLGIGGMQLYKAETPGPMKDNKLTPRITSTAKVLFTIYLVMTIACALCYWLAGMTPFDALAHSFSTVAIGGFSTHDASMAYFENYAVLWIGSVFMLLAGVNFALHYFAFRDRSLLHYWRDSELKFFYAVIFVSCLVAAVLLLKVDGHFAALLGGRFDGEAWLDRISHGVFQVVSLATTTGFASTDYTAWPNLLPLFMFYLAFMGACAGSTGGGLKAIRLLLIIKQGYRELLRLVHPNAALPLKIGHRTVAESVVNAVWSFFAIYVMVFFALMLAVASTGVDYISAFGAVGATLNNLGPGLGDVAFNYASLPSTTKWVLCLSMLLGRLEVFTLLVLFTPAFWRK
ncbi:MAG: TrkH family potassium uptake protein [Gammaproteobacteria bacterium]|nr:TrkH family potassium uptake protein [Gammaproteobacteria bacterium]RZV56518.1 MAG: potassium transporter [Pseudomonadales bacterium]